MKTSFDDLDDFCHPGTNSFQRLGIFHWRLTIKGGDNMPYRIGTSQQTAQGKTAVNIEGPSCERICAGGRAAPGKVVRRIRDGTQQ